MGQVTVTIADKVYRIACNDGQEEHLYKLSAELNRKIAEMRSAFGEIGDNRLTVMAAITFMDDREDLKRRIAELESDVTSIREQHRATDTMHSKLENEIAAAITQTALKLNEIARRLNGEDEEDS
jgi:cell division protein ZapA